MTTENPTTIFRASNTHIEQSGTPPEIDADQPGYHSYFENVYGEQWIFWYDTDNEEGWVWGGDKGWESKHRVLSAPLRTTLETLAPHSTQMTFDSMVADLVLQTAENIWLMACMMAAEESKEFRQGRRNAQD